MNAAPGEQQSGDELRRRRRVDLDRAAGHRTGAAHRERQRRRRRHRHRDARSASSSGAMGRARACSSPSNVTVVVPSAASGGTNRSTVPARPQSTRGAGHRGDRAADASARCVAVDGPDAEGLQRADHQVGVAAAQRAADRRTNPAGGQRGQQQCAVGQRLRARHGDRRMDRARASTGPARCSSLLASARAHGSTCLVAVCCHYGIYVWTIRGDHRSGAAGPEDRGDRREHIFDGERDVERPELQRGADHDHQQRGETAHRPDDESTRRVRPMRWGLIPPWVKTTEDGAPTTRARC